MKKVEVGCIFVFAFVIAREIYLATATFVSKALQCKVLQICIKSRNSRKTERGAENVGMVPHRERQHGLWFAVWIITTCSVDKLLPMCSPRLVLSSVKQEQERLIKRGRSNCSKDLVMIVPPQEPGPFDNIFTILSYADHRCHSKNVNSSPVS